VITAPVQRRQTVNRLPQDKLFVPDQHLGKYVQNRQDEK
jgi:quinolinate synthase